MKVTKVYYNDDSVLVEGYLIERFMRRPIFFPLIHGADLQANAFRIEANW